MAVYKDQYEEVAASATTQVLGPTGGAGDKLFALVVNVTTSATGTVAIKDGSDTAITVVPANTPIGAFTLSFGEFGARSRTGAWQITTGAGASVVAVGDFS